jgi:hypothetical protein
VLAGDQLRTVSFWGLTLSDAQEQALQQAVREGFNYPLGRTSSVAHFAYASGMDADGWSDRYGGWGDSDESVSNSDGG